MIRATLLGVATLLMAASLSAEALHPTFEVAPVWTYGVATELVLRDGTYNNPVSRLQWPVTPGLGIGFTATVPWNTWTGTSASLASTWPLVGGTVVDEDWDTEVSGTPLSYGKSIHSGVLTAHIVASAEEQFYWDDWTISVGGLYRWTSWEAWNGTGDYQFSTGAVTHEFSGLVLSYQQLWLIPYVGVSWTATWQGTTFRPGLRGSPYTWCWDTDNHFYAGQVTKTFLDNVRGGFYARPSVDVSWKLGSLEWGLRGAFDFAWGAVGDTTTVQTYQDQGTVKYPNSSNVAGAWFYEGSFSFFMRN